MSHRHPARLTSTTLLSATLLSLCGLGHAANSAPVLNIPTFAFTAITEDQGTFSITGDQLGLVLGSNPNGVYFDSDILLGGSQGVAITGVDDAHGTWQYSTDNQDVVPPVWVDIPHVGVGGVSATHALLLAFSTADYAALRFVPNAGFNTRDFPAPTITFRAWDRTDSLTPSNSATQFFNDSIGAGGGSTAYSAASSTGSIAVTPVNHAPVLVAGQSVLGADGEGSTGVAIEVLLGAADNGGSVPVTDADTGDGQGIVITGADSSNGLWEYTLDGVTFQAFPNGLADDNALLLASVVDQYSQSHGPLFTGMAVRFTPTLGNFRGTAAFTYRAWDQSNQFQPSGFTVDTATNGGSTPFSTGTRTAVVGNNHAPVLATGTGALGAVTNALTGEIPGVAVSDILAAVNNGGTAPATDDDDDAIGLAVVAADGSHGTWEYATTLGGAFTPFPQVTASTALVLASGALVRFVPKGDFAGTAAITYRAWDGTDGATIQTLVDPGTGGGLSAYSIASRSAAFTVTSSPFTEITDTSGSGLQAVVANLLAPGSQITVDPESIAFVGGTTIGAAQASTMSAIDLGTAADGTHMAIAGTGLLLTSGDGTPNLANPDAASISTSQTADGALSGPGDSDLAAVVGTTTNDACSLSFNFTVPSGIHSVSFQMMFGSEEFSEFINSFTDGAAVFVDGTNVAIFNNDATQFLHVSDAISSLIESNGTASNLATEYNGITRPATVIGALTVGLTVHSIKIVIADSVDAQIDSGLFISSLAGSTATTGGGIVVVPPGPPGSADVAHVATPPIGLSSGSSVIYASVCPSTAEGIANLTSHLAGRPKNQVRGFTWDAITQAYVELPDVPTDGLNDDTGVFIATRLNLGLDFSGTPTDFPFPIVLHPGFNFVGVPPLGTLSSFTTVHQFPDDFTITSGGSTITAPVDIATLLGTPGGDVTTAEPFFWDGSAYVQGPALTTGAGYWIKNNSSSDVTLTRVAPLVSLPGNVGAVASAEASVATRAHVDPASVRDRGVPPPPPGGRSADAGSTTAANGSGGAKSCGLGSGVAAFASMLMLALRRRLRGGRRD